MTKEAKTEDRLGRFKLDRNIVLRRPEVVAQIFAMMELVPVRVDLDTEFMALRYMAISPKFEEIKHGQIVPLYAIKVHEHEGRVDSVSVEPMYDAALHGPENHLRDFFSMVDTEAT